MSPRAALGPSCRPRFAPSYSRRAVARALADAGFTSTMSRSYGRYRLMPGDVAVVATKQA